MRLVIKKKNFIENLFILLVIQFEIMGMIKSSYLFTAAIGLLSTMTFFKYYHKFCTVDNVKVFAFFYFMFFCFLLSHIHNYNVNYNGLIYNIILFPIVMLMLNMKIDLYMMKCVFWLYTFYLCICVIDKIDPNNFFETSSRNYVSVIYIYLLCVLIFSEKEKLKKLNYIYFIIPIIFSIIAIGRGGILCTILFLGGRVFADIVSERNIHKKLLILSLAILIICFAVIIAFNSNGLKSIFFSRFLNEGFHDNARNTIWSRYYTMTINDKWDMLLGARINNDRYLEKQVTGNLHNSLLSMHSRFGLAFLFLNIWLLIRAGLFYLKEKMYDYLLALSIFMLRGMTDILFATFWGDIIWWYFLFFPYYYYYNKKNTQSFMI